MTPTDPTPDRPLAPTNFDAERCDTAIAAHLERFARFGVDLGLDRIVDLLDRLGNPHCRVPIVHVAGTNGKGSVCVSIASILRAAGYRVGRYTSPHLVRWNERVCIDGRDIASDRLLTALETTIAAIDADPPTHTPTQFEVFTAAAWLAFATAEVDIAVIEVGLGGRLDATNVVDAPLVSAIVSIGRDHWQRLGDTLAAIAGEKAGILKRDRPAVVGILPEEARQTVADRIEALNCPTIWAEPAIWVEEESPDFDELPVAQWRGLRYPLPLLGEFQRQNSAVALAAIEQLRTQNWNIPDAAIRQGMATVRWAGRMEWLAWNDRPFLLDGAHNVEAARHLRTYLDRVAPERPVYWAIAMLSVKDIAGVLGALLRPGDRLFAFAVGGHSSAAPSELIETAEQICAEIDAIACDSLTAALDAALGAESDKSERAALTAFCGSLYAVGDAYRDLPLVPIAPPFGNAS